MNDDPPLRDQLAAAIKALGKSETELAALREVARGYCPQCGRGDAAPSAADWEAQRRRADQAEAAHATTIDSLERAVRRARRAEAALARVAALVDECEANGQSSGHPLTVTLIRTALDELAPEPAAKEQP